MSKAGLLLLLSCSAVVLAANVLLRWAMDRSHVKLFSDGVAGLPQEILGLAREPLFLLALCSYSAAMLIWFRLVATEPLSVSYPALAALSFVTVSLAGVFVFGEPLPVLRGLGLFCIILGISLTALAQ
jgi:multidrug transporter EmrE-like cation transporter